RPHGCNGCDDRTVERRQPKLQPEVHFLTAFQLLMVLCSRGLQPAFGSWIVLRLSALERGLKPAATIHFDIYNAVTDRIYSNSAVPLLSLHERIQTLWFRQRNRRYFS